ncbi:ArsR/SmtB family transcription factor [Desulfosporosinus lacus]|uniref:Transcriptional regulator, ArsR family n=1 Tax=Desulfosporosinus lacus DSM 15449 TaxID=1121420 RepID=A0A1M6ER55_9FIRM|nr:metalloregulator ArsR/SmtB family transcription factor [Desulfosporosinus lacus]SHI87942.1 transcriptional regulator, ArsR family [Desulfosporosinus lacus DSM 15449]
MEKLLDALKALSDETRLRILNLLYEKELCVCDIMEALQISQAKASRHLIYLKNAELVKDRKHAQWVYYSMALDERMKFMDSLVYDNLRNLELYQNDLQNLKDWLKRKNIKCD